MSDVSMVGPDLAKHVFQVHGADAIHPSALCKRLRRGQVPQVFSQPRCIVAREACSSAHFRGRELARRAGSCDAFREAPEVRLGGC